MSNRKLALERSEGTWFVVRRRVGYDHYDSKAALEALNRVYGLTRLYVNSFQPAMQLVRKTRHVARIYKVYPSKKDVRSPHVNGCYRQAYSPRSANRS